MSARQRTFLALARRGTRPARNLPGLRKQLARLASEQQIANSCKTLQEFFWPEKRTAVAQNKLRITLSQLCERAGKVAGTVASKMAARDFAHRQDESFTVYLTKRAW